MGDWCGYSDTASSWEGLGAPVMGAAMHCKCNCVSCANFHLDKVRTNLAALCFEGHPRVLSPPGVFPVPLQVFDVATARCVHAGWGQHAPQL